jgi:hypothetical protein
MSIESILQHFVHPQTLEKIIVTDGEALVQKLEGKASAAKSDVANVKKDVQTVKAIETKVTTEVTKVEGGVKVVETDVKAVVTKVDAEKPVVETEIKKVEAVIKSDIAAVEADAKEIVEKVEAEVKGKPAVTAK